MARKLSPRINIVARSDFIDLNVTVPQRRAIAVLRRIKKLHEHHLYHAPPQFDKPLVVTITVIHNLKNQNNGNNKNSPGQSGKKETRRKARKPART
jgi:hypothetical protein